MSAEARITYYGTGPTGDQLQRVIATRVPLGDRARVLLDALRLERRLLVSLRTTPRYRPFQRRRAGRDYRAAKRLVDAMLAVVSGDD